MSKFRRKGIIITKVIIDSDENLSAYTDENELVKLTRAQRNVLNKHKSSTYLSDIRSIFQNANIIEDGNLIVIRKDKQVYPVIKK